MKVKQYLAGIAIFAMALCLAACMGGNKNADDAMESAAESMADNDPTMTSQIPNPFVECDTIEDAADVAGFSMTVPESLDGYEGQYIQAIEGSLLQVAYGDNEQELLMRKAPGSDDISGDYNSYPKTTTAQVNGNEVTMKGDDDGVQVATWMAGGYSYAVDVTGMPLSVEAMTAVVEKIS